MQRIRITEKPEFTSRFPEAMVTEIEVHTRSGARHGETASYPRGHAKNPMTDAEVDAKFAALAAGTMPDNQRDKLLAALREIERAPAIGNVLDMVRVQR